MKQQAQSPHGWIQWKGTNVCMEVYCQCGAHTHIDADFLYKLRCSACGQVYEVDPRIRLNPLIGKHEDAQTTDKET